MKTKEQKPSNPAAFPLLSPIDRIMNEGMTLRDYYAGQAMIYFINANNGNFCDNDASQIFYIADTMLKQREL